jgi:hypothetical protein
MDDADAFWGANLASRFTDEMIHAIVAAGELSNPKAARYLEDVIIRRRDKVVAYWITRTNPLDGFTVSRRGGTTELGFDNAAVRLQVATPDAVYKVRWQALDNLSRTLTPVGEEATLAGTRAEVPAAAWGTDDCGTRYAVAFIRTEHPGFASWNRPVQVTLRSRNGVVDVVGIARPANGGEQ